MATHQAKNKELGLTQSQISIWLGQQLFPNTPLYNSPFTFDFSVSIQIPQFQFAFQMLINQHEVLRTVFLEQNGIPKQKVLSELFYEIELIDYSKKGLSEQEIQKYIQSRSEKLLDISKICFDTCLLKINNNRFIWFINQHHLITDGWSMTILFREMMAHYQSLLNEKTEQITSAPQFSEYLEFQKSIQYKPSWKDAQNYWTDKTNALPLPAKLYGLDNNNSTKSQRITFPFGKDRMEQLNQLASQKQVRNFTKDLTYFNIFTTLLFAYNYRISHQREITIAVPAHNRTLPEHKNTLGLFIELFPLTVEIEEDDTFLSILKKVRTESSYFLRNVQTGTSSVDLHKKYHSVLNYINVSFPEIEGMPYTSEWLHPNQIDAGHHLRLEVHDFYGTGEFRFEFDFNSGAIPEPQQTTAIQHFMNLFDAFLNDVDQPVSKVSMISELERNQILGQSNSDKKLPSYSTNIIEQFIKSVQNNANQIAVITQNQSITYQKLDERSNQLANYLIEKGIQKEEIIGLYQSRSIDLIVSILGILKTGAAYLPLSSLYPKERLSYMVNNSKTRFILSEKELQSDLDFFDGEIIIAQGFESSNTSFELQEISPSQLAYVIYTSGSTGQPKGAMNEHQGVLRLVNNLDEHIYKRYQHPLNIVMVAPIVFDPSVQQIFASLLLGHTLHIVSEELRMNGKKLHKYYLQNDIHITDGTPSHLRLLLNAPKNQNLPKHFIIGGEKMPANLIHKFQKHFNAPDAIITNIYGVAECGVDSVAYDIHLHQPWDENTPVPIGKPLANDSVYILNQFHQPQPVGTVGELYIGGLGVGRGYINQPDLAQERFIKNPFSTTSERLYKTGDLARWLPNGNLEFINRKDNQIKIRGYRIEIGEIEYHLRQFNKTHSDVTTIENIPTQTKRCKKCLLSEHHPGTTFDENGICNTCNGFDHYQNKANQYFKSVDDFKVLMSDAQKEKTGNYDIMLLYSGGKDSSYVLYRLVEMGYKVLAFTFDNGFISKAAFDNIERQTSKLGVESIIRKTDKMDEIFIESLNSDSTVCSGCFKSLTAISTLLAEEMGINVIITGLSRGQIFDTKLSGLYQQGVFEVDEIEHQLLEFRKVFHAANDRTSRLLDLDLTQVEFEKIHFIDFFRYDQTAVSDIREYLKMQDSFWRQPKDTGFCSSNCLMNDIGICMHSQQQGYHNYEAPLSWDIRLGISTRAETLHEVEGQVNLKQVKSVLNRIGYFKKAIKDAFVMVKNDKHQEPHLVAYFTANHKISISELRKHLAVHLPNYMIPSYFVQLEQLPLTPHGKLDYKALPAPDFGRPIIENEYIAPSDEIQELVAEIWQDIFEIEKIGIYDNFLELGGNSITAIQIMARLNENLELDLPLSSIFEIPTIQALSKHIEETIIKLLEEAE